MTDRPGDEAGFTLPELLLSIVILGIIVGAIGAALIVGLRTTDTTQQRLAGSHDRQLVSIYLPNDLLSTSSVQAADVAAPTTSQCTGVPGGTTNVVRLHWSEYDAAGSPTPTTLMRTYEADYRTVNASGEWQLVRYSCQDGATAKSLVVAHNLRDGTSNTAAASGRQVTLTLTDAAGISYVVSGDRRSG